MTLLEKIVEAKRAEIAARKKIKPLSELQKRFKTPTFTRDFKESLKGKGIQLIGEIKRVSPLNGVLRHSFDPVALAQAYRKAGAASLSVLTDEPFFGGRLSYLGDVRRSVSLPLLRKDFILEEYQVYESAEAGSDALLLISSLLSEKELSSLLQCAKRIGMATLVEVHSEEDLKKALWVEAEIIGINNRDLHSFKIDFATSERLVKRIPKEKIIVSESGIHSRKEVKRLEALGFNAVLIGQAFMEKPDLEKAVHEVMGR